jgi:bifunctional DNA-binding transcriptional regulator/antitoxin component of YhaV-PrlF toxin-antitoxin module
LADELLLGITILGRGGTTNIPKQAREMLKLKPTRQKREKLLWTQRRDEIIVTKGTPQSDFRKTMLRRNGTAAVPRHIREVLKLSLHNEERVLWTRRGDEVVVRKGLRQSSPTD